MYIHTHTCIYEKHVYHKQNLNANLFEPKVLFYNYASTISKDFPKPTSTV